MKQVLYLHGRHSTPRSAPGDVVHQQGWPMPLFAPNLTDDWLGKLFSHQIDQVETWLDSSAVALGHSFGAWLLLCAAVQQLDRGVCHPRLLLLSTLLGRGFNPRMRMGYFAPRPQRVHAALGLEGTEPELPVDELFFVHGEDDEQCPVEPIRELGSSVSL